jgi:deoxyribonuclease V
MLEEEAIKRGMDLESLKEEQKKLAKSVSEKDAFDFKNATRIAGISTEILKTKEIISAIAILDENLEVIEEKYSIKPLKFPYIPGFRAYRELPGIFATNEKLEDQPDVYFVEGSGIAHERGLGLASHFGITINRSTIGISNSVNLGKENETNVILNKKVIAKKVVTKHGARPIYVSIGNMISLDSAIELTKKCIKEPHKLPEPIVEARKIITRVKKEMNL